MKTFLIVLHFTLSFSLGWHMANYIEPLKKMLKIPEWLSITILAVWAFALSSLLGKVIYSFN